MLIPIVETCCLITIANSIHSVHTHQATPCSCRYSHPPNFWDWAFLSGTCQALHLLLRLLASLLFLHYIFCIFTRVSSSSSSYLLRFYMCTLVIIILSSAPSMCALIASSSCHRNGVKIQTQTCVYVNVGKCVGEDIIHTNVCYKRQAESIRIYICQWGEDTEWQLDCENVCTLEGVLCNLF